MHCATCAKLCLVPAESSEVLAQAFWCQSVKTGGPLVELGLAEEQTQSIEQSAVPCSGGSPAASGVRAGLCDRSG